MANWELRAKTDREPYAAVGEATRAAIDKALANDLTAGEIKVLFGVIHLLTTRSRLWDWTSHKQIAEIAGISRRSVIRGVRRLAEVGSITWEPGSPTSLSKLAFAERPVVTKLRHHKPPPKEVLVHIDGDTFRRTEEGGLELVPEPRHLPSDKTAVG